MKINSHAGTILAAAAAALSLAPFAQAAANVEWAKTATQGISLSQLISASDRGALPKSEPLTIRVALQLRNKTALLSYVKAIATPGNPLYGQSLTPAQFAASYAPSSVEVAQVVAYLRKSGFTGIVVEPNSLLISANGTTMQAETAFHTHLEQFFQFDALAYGNT